MPGSAALNCCARLISSCAGRCMGGSLLLEEEEEGLQQVEMRGYQEVNATPSTESTLGEPDRAQEAPGALALQLASPCGLAVFNSQLFIADTGQRRTRFQTVDPLFLLLAPQRL